jgi:hypothetical protein
LRLGGGKGERKMCYNKEKFEINLKNILRIGGVLLAIMNATLIIYSLIKILQLINNNLVESKAIDLYAKLIAFGSLPLCFLIIILCASADDW